MGHRGPLRLSSDRAWQGGAQARAGGRPARAHRPRPPVRVPRVKASAKPSRAAAPQAALRRGWTGRTVRRPHPGTPPLFTGLAEAPLRAGQVQWAWRQARRRAGLLDVHFHDLRHAGLTLSAPSGATLAEVMRRAGHASSAAALRYQHAADWRDADVAQRMSSFVRRGTPGGV